jgi:hypothetical protein
MNKTKTIASALLIAFISNASIAQETKSIEDFTGISVGDNFTVIISQSENNSIKIEASETDRPKIKTEIKDNTLHISADGNINQKLPVLITVNAKNLQSLNVMGSATVKTDNTITGSSLSIKSSGAGDVNIETTAADIKADISGAGDLTLKGSTQQLTAEVSGAGDLKSSHLIAEKVKVKVSGAGNAKVNAVKTIDADVSGAGSIIYKGNPAERNVNISGAGSVRESQSGNGEETASDTTKIKLGNKKYMIIDDETKPEKKYSYKDSVRNHNNKYKHWNGWEIGVNGFMDYKNSLDVPVGATFLELDYSKSLQFGLNLMEKDFHIYKNYINLVTGLGFDFNHYAFKNNISLMGDTTYLWATNDNVKYKKNKLNVSYLKAPLLLEINTSKNPDKNFHIAGGIEFAYRIHSVAKQKFEANDKHIKVKQRDDFNLEPFRYSAVARIGYKNVTIFANYGLNRLFQKNKGPQVYPFSIGATFAFD